MRPIAAEYESSLLSLMLEHATDGICLVGSDGTVLATTPAIERMLSMEPGSLSGLNGLSLLHPDDLEPALTRLAQIGDAVPEDYRLYRFRHADGHYVMVELVARENPEFVAASPGGTLVLTVRDVTDYHQARSELDQVRRRTELVAQIAARFVDALDDEIDDQVHDVLAKLVVHTGADRADLFRLAPDWSGMHRTHQWTRPGLGTRDSMQPDITPDAFPAWRDKLLALESIVVPDTTELDPAWTVERDAIRQMGTAALLVVPLVREGIPVGFLALDSLDHPLDWRPDDIEMLRVAVDIMGSALARRDATEASRTAEGRFRAMVENSSDALIVLDREARISRPPVGRQLFGYSAEELMGMNALDLVHPDDLDFAASEMLKAIEDPGYQATNAMRIRHAAGTLDPNRAGRFESPRRPRDQRHRHERA